MTRIRGTRTHIDVAAVHEAGHALAAVREGRWIQQVQIRRDQPGAGVVYHSRQRSRNPYDPSVGTGSARAAWLHTLDRYSADLRIKLAGPLAEAKALNQPMRSLGAYSDLNGCHGLASSLEAHWVTLRSFADIEPVGTAAWMNSQRQQVRRWLGRPKVWYLVLRVADLLARQGALSGPDVYRELARIQAPAPQQTLEIHVLSRPATADWNRGRRRWPDSMEIKAPTSFILGRDDINPHTHVSRTFAI